MAYRGARSLCHRDPGTGLGRGQNMAGRECRGSGPRKDMQVRSEDGAELPEDREAGSARAAVILAERSSGMMIQAPDRI